MPPKYTMSDSESDAETEAPGAPSDQTLEQNLRDQVAAIFKLGNMEELTVKRVRLAVENKLGLTSGYFKSTGDWKARSEEIIREEVEIQDKAAQDPEPEAAGKSPPSPVPEQRATLAKRPKPKSAPKPRKRQKTTTLSSDNGDEKEEDEDGNEDENDNFAPGDESDEVTVSKPQKEASRKKAPQKSKKPIKDEGSGGSDAAADSSGAPKATTDAMDDSESEMSVVLDEEPKPKAPRKRQKTADGPSKTKKAPKAKAKDEDISPDQAEIKRLQGWLIKCGIRKLWGKELAPFDTTKAKIKHLKGMLEDAGMKGRPSQEKASQIREERELKADLELIKEGAKHWGKKDDDEGEDDERPRRRLNRGHQSLAFLDSDDGEETD